MNKEVIKENEMIEKLRYEPCRIAHESTKTGWVLRDKTYLLEARLVETSADGSKSSRWVRMGLFARRAEAVKAEETAKAFAALTGALSLERAKIAVPRAKTLLGLAITQADEEHASEAEAILARLRQARLDKEERTVADGREVYIQDATDKAEARFDKLEERVEKRHAKEEEILAEAEAIKARREAAKAPQAAQAA